MLLIGPAISEVVSVASHMVLSKNSIWHPSATVFNRYAEATLWRFARQPVLPMPAWRSPVWLHCGVGKRSKDHWMSRCWRGEAAAAARKRARAVMKVGRANILKNVLSRRKLVSRDAVDKDTGG